jgi:hypothetical protein
MSMFEVLRATEFLRHSARALDLERRLLEELGLLPAEAQRADGPEQRVVLRLLAGEAEARRFERTLPAALLHDVVRSPSPPG